MRQLSILLGLVLMLFTVSACKQEASATDSLVTRGTWRYKMTVVVETPEGLKTGSAVREMSNSYSKIRIDFPQSTNPAKLVGEAVVVDLGERGKLFALLKGYRYDVNHAHSIVYQYLGGGTNAAGIKALANLKDVKRTIDPNDYPVFVTFTDVHDARSISEVLEMEPDTTPGNHSKYNLIADHTEELFGRGVKIKEVTIETTDEPTTLGVVDQHKPYSVRQIMKEWRQLSDEERTRLIPLLYLKTGNLATYHDRVTECLVRACTNDNRSYKYLEMVA